MLQLNEVRIETMCRLYAKYIKRPWDGEYLDWLDTALNLTLGDKRAAEDPDHLCRNVIRDVRRTIRRAHANAREQAACRPLADAARRRVCSTSADGAMVAEVITHVTPEDCAVAAETLQELRAFARALGSHGTACLQGMLDMMTVADCAVQTQRSVATVERTRRALRQHAKTLISITA
ncbi:hypothetical protein CP967_15305 [Streptomyces nitrosporeus]|uniref:Uncharacterized protein n=1 Tax=Streptomyces nitrosporeus TaxID=28894 RepID=A0A5J6FE75_9ACTN|nr:hypothetical protein [Streptomyces nitrosporeus]QEU73190.1 hypothetical protein CP967_15305 [Streptomyces nitrosporeus]GGZ09842.1 hypothetical protein GCM10010327_45590 [Streptomyces nitrosporeus]